MDENYESEPIVITRDNGSTIRLYRSKTDPNAFLPIQDDGTVFDIGAAKYVGKGNVRP